MGELIATVEQDFEFDLASGENASWLGFPFRGLIISNEKYKQQLFKEFNELLPEPKYAWYHKSELENGYLSDDEKYRWDNHHQKNIFYNDVESKLNDLHYKFIKSKNKLDEKYNGRNLLDAPIVRTLLAIGEQISNFEKFISSEKVVNVETFAQAFASELIDLTNKLDNPSLKIEILNFFINKREDVDLNYTGLVSEGVNKFLYRNSDKLGFEYNSLKLCANKIIRDEILNGNYSNDTKFEYDTDAHLLIPIKKIADFYKFCILKDLFEKPIDELNFIACFNSKPQQSNYPKFKIKNQFVYFLSQFKAIDNKVAKSNFGLGNYTNDKSEIKKRAKPKLEITAAIDKIVKQD